MEVKRAEMLIGATQIGRLGDISSIGSTKACRRRADAEIVDRSHDPRLNTWATPFDDA
jgi:hypothetical protein